MIPKNVLTRSVVALTAAAVLFVTPVLARTEGTDEPTVEEARAFMDEAEKVLRDLWEKASRAGWVQSTYITDDTEILAAEAQEAAVAKTIDLVNEAERFQGLEMDEDLARRFKLLKLSLTAPAPQDAEKIAELTQLTTSMESLYGKGEYCPEDGECQDLQELSKIMAQSRDPEALREAWTGWRTISPPMRPKYERFVELSNEGSRALGFADTGAFWRSKYDMEPDAFAQEVNRIWEQVKPFYESLHCYVRAELNEEYGDAVQPLDGPIRADLLGNMWAQEWANIYPLVAPPGGDNAVDVTALLKEQGVDAKKMVEYGEAFFTSLGFEPLPETFWERSMFTQPEDRDVVCHASAWSIDWENDLRIKMCIDTTEEDFVTIHHELGHNFYQRAYNDLSIFYQDSANDGFHEAVGDTIALSVTPEYLKKVGLLDEVPPAEDDTGMLLKMALDKIAFLPFGLLIDQWRWDVFSGEITPEEYNAAWWEMRTKYQGIRPPVERSEADFDPGAKYHIPANTPYTRYFLARVLQFQFHRALCEIAGNEAPLHRCSIYGSEEAGRRLGEMLSMGVSRPWPEALEALTGDRQIDATAIVDYFAPLKTWLDEQNEGRTCGW